MSLIVKYSYHRLFLLYAQKIGCDPAATQARVNASQQRTNNSSVGLGTGVVTSWPGRWLTKISSLITTAKWRTFEKENSGTITTFIHPGEIEVYGKDSNEITKKIQWLWEERMWPCIPQLLRVHIKFVAAVFSSFVSRNSVNIEMVHDVKALSLHLVLSGGRCAERMHQLRDARPYTGPGILAGLHTWWIIWSYPVQIE